MCKRYAYARAVSHFSSHSGDEFRLLLRLAEYADANGVIDPAPSRETMAAWYNVPERTITNRIRRLLADGELVRTRLGSGPGRPSAYLITLPLPEGTAVDASAEAMGETVVLPMGEKGERFGQLKGEKGESIEARLSRLESQVAQIFTLLGEMGEKIDHLTRQMGENFGHYQNGKGENFSQFVNGKGEKGENFGQLKGEKGESLPEVERPRSYKEKEYIYISSSPEHTDALAPAPEQIPQVVYDMITAVAKAVKTPYWPKTESDFMDAAYFLIGKDATQEQLSGFQTWWDANGHYKGKPALSSLLMEWDNYVAGVTHDKPEPAVSANGTGADPYRLALKHAKDNDKNFADPRLYKTVQRFGWARLQTIKPGAEDFCRAEFMGIYNEQAAAAA